MADLSRIKRVSRRRRKDRREWLHRVKVMAPAEMVGRLLGRYGFSMDAIEIPTARCVQGAAPAAIDRRL